MALHVEVVGAGAPLVLVHGWGLHGGVFAPLVARLSARHELHLVDLPGHGHSRALAPGAHLGEDVGRILARVPPATWLGWSLGGLHALQAAASSPRVHALVMVAATPRFVRGPDWPHAVEASVFEQFGRDLAGDYPGTLQRFLALDTIGSEHARDELRVLRQALHARGEPDARALQHGLGLLGGSDLRPLLPTLAVPSLWLSGRRDRLVSPVAMAEAARLCGGQHVDIAGGGHAPFLGHADQVAAAVAGFLAGVPGRDGLHAVGPR